MVRDYKFRAWDDLNKKWLLGYEYPSLGGFSMMGEVMAFGEYSNMLSSFKLEDWDKILLSQFSGKKDVNKKDIYEGDVNQDGGILIWNPDDASFCWEYEDVETQPMGEEELWCTITGNIYEKRINMSKVIYTQGKYYYNDKLCEIIEDIFSGGQITETIFDYPYAYWDVYDNGYILGTTMGGRKILKIID